MGGNAGKAAEWGEELQSTVDTDQTVIVQKRRHLEVIAVLREGWPKKIGADM
jgi:hypothetical protein